jgi:predicted membrane-bound spermidine synthase
MFPPTVATRSDATGQAPTYVGFVGGAIALFAAFLAVPKLKRSRGRTSAVVASIVPFLVAVAGLFHLPLSLYTYTFAVSVAALVVAVLSLAALR